MPRGLRHAALSISFLSPIVSRPPALPATKMASFIFLPDRRFLDFTSFHSRTRPNLSFGSSSLISLRRQAFALSRVALPAARKHPQPIAPAPDQKDFAAPYRYQFRGLRHLI